MTRVFIANPGAAERSALCLMLHDLHMEVVGDVPDWTALLAGMPESNPDILLVDWEILLGDPAANLSGLRRACSEPFYVVLTSHLEARQQAAISVGADAFISRFEGPARLADRLFMIAKSLEAKNNLRHLDHIQRRYHE